jgi:chemotaxis protein CheX
MDVNYINPFVVAVKDVFSTMIGLPLKLKEPSIKKKRAPDFEISGIIGLSGTVTGCVVISLEEKLAVQLASALMQETVDTFDDDAVDAIGEIANMVVGNAKSSFPEEGCAISVPSVITGRHRVSFPSTVPIINIPCEIGLQKLSIDVAIKKSP